MFSSALTDFQKSLCSWRLWCLLGWIEIRQRYARSTVGPFWLTLSMGTMIASIGVVYGTLFGQNLREYLPFLSAGLIMWAFLSQVVNEGASAYICSSSYIRQATTPKTLYVLQVVWRNTVVLAHNMVILIVLLAVFGVKSWGALAVILPGFLLFVANATWMALIAALISARFRDLPQVIASLLQVAFYVSPIMYRPAALKSYSWVVDLNPMTYLLQLVRAPILGEFPSMLAWELGGAMAMAGWALALWLTGRYLKRIPYWV